MGRLRLKTSWTLGNIHFTKNARSVKRVNIVIEIKIHYMSRNQIDNTMVFRKQGISVEVGRDQYSTTWNLAGRSVIRTRHPYPVHSPLSSFSRVRPLPLPCRQHSCWRGWWPRNGHKTAGHPSTGIFYWRQRRFSYSASHAVHGSICCVRYSYVRQCGIATSNKFTVSRSEVKSRWPQNRT